MKEPKDLSQLTDEELLFKALEIIYKAIDRAESQGRVNLRDAAIYCKSVAAETISEYKSRKVK
jgi:hypothetical protein